MSVSEPFVRDGRPGVKDSSAAAKGSTVVIRSLSADVKATIARAVVRPSSLIPQPTPLASSSVRVEANGATVLTSRWFAALSVASRVVCDRCTSVNGLSAPKTAGPSVTSIRSNEAMLTQYAIVRVGSTEVTTVPSCS